MGSKRKAPTDLAEHFEHPVSSAARSLNKSLEAAVDIVAGRGYSTRARALAANRRKRFQAATSIQALFRGHQVRKAGRQRMQIDRHGVPMPPRRRRRGRRAPKRKRRTSYTRKRRRSKVARRKRRKSSTRTRLRLYPSGFPRTHLIKLRLQKQVKITNSPNNWASMVFFPAQCSDPFVAMQAATGADAGPNHQLMKWTLKNDAILPRPQPYGWDEWANQSPYEFAVVEGSKTTLTFIQSNSAGVGSTYRMLAGFSRLTEARHDSFMPAFHIEYANIHKDEISDMMNIKMIPHSKILNLSGNGVELSTPTSFTFNYSRKKITRRMKKMGAFAMKSANESLFMFDHDSTPGFNPQVRFIIADIGASAETISWNCFITIEYTLRLQHRIIADESKITT